MKSNEYRHWHIKFPKSFFFFSVILKEKMMVALRLSSLILIYWMDPNYRPLNVCFPKILIYVLNTTERPTSETHTHRHTCSVDCLSCLKTCVSVYQSECKGVCVPESVCLCAHTAMKRNSWQ